jgi:hypothetical protein
VSEEKQKCIVCEPESEDYFDTCKKHKNCYECGGSGPYWSTRKGLQCKPCHAKQIEEQITKFQKRLEEEGSWLLECESEPVCPHCGYIQGDAWEWANQEEDDDTCGNCGNEYTYERCITVEYSTRKK